MELLKLSGATVSSIPFINEPIKLIKSGFNHIVIITKYNNIYSYGNNNKGQCGIGNIVYDFVDTFTKINDLTFSDKTIINNKFQEITHLECNRSATMIVNNYNEIHFTGEFDLDRFVYKNLQHHFIHIHTFINDKINILRLGSKFFVISTISNNSELLLCTSLHKKVTCFKHNLSNKITEIVVSDNLILIMDSLGNIYFKECQFTYNNNPKFEEEFKKVDLSFKVKKIAIGDPFHIFILNENNELFGKGSNNYGLLGLSTNNLNYSDFTKIVIENCDTKNILNIYTSFHGYTIITTINNEIFICGSNEKERFINENNKACKYKSKFYSNEFSGYYVDKFIKLDYFETNKKFIYPLLLRDEVFVLTSKYKLNGRLDEEENYLGEELSKRLQKEIYCDCNLVYSVNGYCCNLKKRNRNIFENDK
ncbi:hypothetical protein ABK040_016441 [Willaertia magna]